MFFEIWNGIKFFFQNFLNMKKGWKKMHARRMTFDKSEVCRSEIETNWVWHDRTVKVALDMWSRHGQEEGRTTEVRSNVIQHTPTRLNTNNL